MMKFNYLCSPSVSLFVWHVCAWVCIQIWLPSQEKLLLLPRPNCHRVSVPVSSVMPSAPTIYLLQFFTHRRPVRLHLAFWLSRPTLIMLMTTFVKQNPWQRCTSAQTVITYSPDYHRARAAHGARRHSRTGPLSGEMVHDRLNCDLKDKWFQTSLARLYNPNSGSENRQDKERGGCRCWNSDESKKKKEKRQDKLLHIRLKALFAQRRLCEWHPHSVVWVCH